MDESRDVVPSHQHAWDGLEQLDELKLHIRRETVFLILSGLFLGSLAMLNILGISRFLKLWDPGVQVGGVDVIFAVAVGVLPYPLTFLCTDFISELYGRKRASRVVWMGLLLNVWVMGVLWVGGLAPGFEAEHPLGSSVAAEVVGALPEDLEPDRADAIGGALATRSEALEASAAAWASSGAGVDPSVLDGLEDEIGELDAALVRERFEEAAGAAVSSAAGRDPVFYEIRRLAFGAVVASMLAYLVAQLVDVHVFHFWKRLTKGKHLWLRNNGSTLVSQLVDSTAVILITHFYAAALPIKEGPALWGQLAVFIASGYAFKLLAALIDTLPFYWGSRWLRRYLRLSPATAPDIV